MATINPLGGPINYMALTPQVDIAKSFTEGLQAGSGFRDVQLREQAVFQKEADRQTALQVQQQYATDVQSAFASPDYETEFAKLAAKYPAQREALKQSFGGLDKTVRDNELRISTQALLAVENGKPEIAVDMINQSITAAKNSGRPTARLEQLASTVNDDPEKFKKNLSYILNTFDPENYKKIREGQIKDVEAGVAPEMAKANLASLVAEVKVKEETAKNASEKARVELLQQAATLGLTNAQKSASFAQTKKLGIDTQMAALQLEGLKASGGVDPDKKFTQEEKIRKEYQARTKVYGELQTTFSNIKASAEAKTGPGDIALITGFMKMLDPGSVVRETEFATARDTAGLYERLLNQQQKLTNGQLFALNSKQRQEYQDLAKQYLDAAQKKAGEEKTALGVVVKNYKLNPENVFGPTNVSVDY